MKKSNSGRVSQIAFGGLGIVKDEGKVIFVPHTVPGDLISYQIKANKKNYVVAELCQVLEPGESRVAPRCPYFGQCGGCDLQQMEYSAQLKAKREWVAEALVRIGRINDAQVPPLIPAVEEWEYRRKITLTLVPQGRRFRLGYFETDGKKVVAVAQCQIFIPPHERLLSILQESVEQLVPQSSANGKVSVHKSSRGNFLIHFHFNYFPIHIEKICHQLMDQTCVGGILASSKTKTLSLGDKNLTLEVDGLLIEYSSTAFIQSHPEQSNKIYHYILEQLGRLCISQGVVLDLYCGVGILSLLLAKRGWQVQGVELNAEAVKLARISAKKNQIDAISFIAGDVADQLPVLQKLSPKAIILNPPREGLEKKVIKELLSGSAPFIFYISCMPATLARDLKLLQEGYQILQIQPFDMFPQTTHVETVVALQRKSICSH